MKIDSIIKLLSYYDILSFDVFDTLLLRKPTPELTHFKNISRLYAKTLKTCFNIERNVNSIHFARYYAARIEYSFAPFTKNNREGRFINILKIMQQALYLPEIVLDNLYETELKYEKSILFPNVKLLPIIEAAKRSKKKVVSISDMYLSKNDITDLLFHFFPSIEFDHVYVSSEFGLTKHQGGLYPHVRKDLDAKCDSILHLGDNFFSDVINAKRFGIKGVWIPRSKMWRLIKKVREKIASYRFQTHFHIQI